MRLVGERFSNMPFEGLDVTRRVEQFAQLNFVDLPRREQLQRVDVVDCFRELVIGEQRIHIDPLGASQFAVELSRDVRSQAADIVGQNTHQCAALYGRYPSFDRCFVCVDKYGRDDRLCIGDMSSVAGRDRPFAIRRSAADFQGQPLHVGRRFSFAALHLDLGNK